MTMLSITDLDVRTRFDELLGRVANGESVVVTRDGRPFARITPAHDSDVDRRRQAIARLRSFSRGQTLDGVSVRSLIDEGRR